MQNCQGLVYTAITFERFSNLRTTGRHSKVTNDAISKKQKRQKNTKGIENRNGREKTSNTFLLKIIMTIFDECRGWCILIWPSIYGKKSWAHFGEKKKIYSCFRYGALWNNSWRKLQKLSFHNHDIPKSKPSIFHSTPSSLSPWIEDHWVQGHHEFSPNSNEKIQFNQSKECLLSILW